MPQELSIRYNGSPSRLWSMALTWGAFCEAGISPPEGKPPTLGRSKKILLITNRSRKKATHRYGLLPLCSSYPSHIGIPLLTS
jgi:hypothetical protein